MNTNNAMNTKKLIPEETTMEIVRERLDALVTTPEVKTMIRNCKDDDHFIHIAAAGMQLRHMLSPEDSLSYYLAAYLLVTRARELAEQERGERSVAV